MIGNLLAGLRFDTPDNAALSLRVIAEKIRVGDLLLADATCERLGIITLTVVEPAIRAPRPNRAPLSAK